MTEDEMNTLREKRKKLWLNTKSSHSAMIRARVLLDTLTKRYQRDLEIWQKCDKELALVDGRLKVEPPASADTPRRRSTDRRKTINVDLTPEQILAIIKKMGIELPEV